jgi:hypothetical protein
MYFQLPSHGKRQLLGPHSGAVIQDPTTYVWIRFHLFLFDLLVFIKDFLLNPLLTIFFFFNFLIIFIIIFMYAVILRSSHATLQITAFSLNKKFVS